MNSFLTQPKPSLWWFELCIMIFYSVVFFIINMSRCARQAVLLTQKNQKQANAKTSGNPKPNTSRIQGTIPQQNGFSK
jgi:hypothetical protein